MEEVLVTITNPAAHPKTKEILNQPSYDSLGSRILLTVSNFDKFHPILDPNKTDVAAITEQDIEPDRKQHNLIILNEVSNDERHEKNGVAKEKLPKAIQEWATDAAERFNRIQPLKEQLQSFLRMDKSADFTREQIAKYYDKYFDRTDQGSKYEVFVDDIIRRYANDESFDFEAYNRDLDGIRFFSRKFFGEEADLSIQKYITHWINFKKDPQKYVEEANKEINNVKETHKPHLERLSRKAQEIKTGKKDEVPLGEIKAIHESGKIITKKSQIPEVVEAPLVSAAEHLWDLNIRTLYSSANSDDIGHDGYLILDYDSLSDENKKIAEKFATYTPDSYDAPAIEFSFPITAKATLPDIKKQADEFAERFKKQRASWVPSYSLQEIKEKYNRYPVENASDIEDFVKMGLYYDEESKRFYLSEEHFQKFNEKIE